MPQKKYLPGLALFSISCLIIFIFCELISRHLERRYFFDTSVYVQQAKPLLHKRSDIPGLGYELIPFAETENGLFSINSQGIRDREYTIPKPDNVYRIIVLGDSVTFGTEYPLKFTYPKILESALNNNPRNKVRFEVLNAGVCAYNAIQKLLFFKNRLIKYQPDLVIYQFLNDDYYRNAVILKDTKKLCRKGTCLSIGEYFALNFPKISFLPEKLDRMFIKHSAFYRLINKTIYDYLSLRRPDLYPAQAYKYAAYDKLDDSMRANKKIFKEFSSLSKKYNFDFVLLLVPELSNIDKMDPWIKYSCPELYDFKTIDLYNEFKKPNIDFEDLRVVPTGLCHFNKLGHKITAQIINNWLNKEILH